MRRTLASLVMAAAITLVGCNLDLTNPNNPTLKGCLSNTRACTSRMIAGVMATYRSNRTDQIRALGSFGRETYYMFITDGRFITGPLRDWKQNNAFDAGTQWGARYQNYHNAYAAMQIINNTPTTTTPGLPTALLAGEKAGALGVLKTFIALDLLHVIEARSAIGAVVDMNGDVNAVLPIVSQDSVYKWISAKLDEAKAEVDSAGTAFYFAIYTGFSTGVPTDGTTPAGFAQFNRAIKARVEAKRGSLGCGATCYTAALTALTSTWIADLTAANRDNGIYSVYSSAAGDFLNNASFAGVISTSIRGSTRSRASPWTIAIAGKYRHAPPPTHVRSPVSARRIARVPTPASARRSRSSGTRSWCCSGRRQNGSRGQRPRRLPTSQPCGRTRVARTVGRQ